MPTYVISHTNSDGHTGIAQMTVTAKSETAARKSFTEQHPDRVISIIAKKA